MIYAYKKGRSKTAYTEGFALAQQRATAAEELYRGLDGGEIESYKLSIPQRYARLETDKRSSVEEVEDVPHYEIHIMDQVGNINSRDKTLAYFRLPHGGSMFSIILNRDGSVGFAKHEHKFILRVSDELDRRIVLGFCKMYSGNIASIAYGKNRYRKDKDAAWLRDEAASYNAGKQPKRIKSGCYGECGIFTNIQLI